MHELMQEGTNQQSPTIPPTPQYRRAQHNQRLKPAVTRTAQRRRANDTARVVVILRARRVRPVPGDALTQPAVEEDLVGGGKDALEG